MAYLLVHTGVKCLKPLIRITLLVLTLFMLDTLTTAPEVQAASVVLTEHF